MQNMIVEATSFDTGEPQAQGYVNQDGPKYHEGVHWTCPVCAKREEVNAAEDDWQDQLIRRMREHDECTPPAL